MDKFLTVAEAALMLDVGVSRFYRLAALYALPSVRVGKRLIFREQDVRTLQKRFKQNPSLKSTATIPA